MIDGLLYGIRPLEFIYTPETQIFKQCSNITYPVANRPWLAETAILARISSTLACAAWRPQIKAVPTVSAARTGLLPCKCPKQPRARNALLLKGGQEGSHTTNSLYLPSSEVAVSMPPWSLVMML